MNVMKVIWLDDEHETLEVFIDRAREFGIKLIGFSNAEEGLAELKRNFDIYDALVVDGLFFLNKSKEKNETNSSAFVKVAAELNSLKDRGKVIPWFILSGEPSFISDEKGLVDTLADKNFAEGGIFEKNEKDFDLLCNAILETIDDSENYHLKNNFRKVFEALEKHINPYLGTATEARLLEILKSMEKPRGEFDDELYFQKLRLIIEALFRSANNYGLLHDRCIGKDGRVNLTESALFLSGKPTKHLGVGCRKNHFPRIIADIVKSILFITGASAHTVDPEFERNIDLKDYRYRINTPYLLYSLTYQLMDVLLWYKSYIEENPDRETNKTFWVNTIGQIEQGDGELYFCEEVLLNSKYIRQNFKVGDIIKIIDWDNNNNHQTNAKYPLFAKRIEQVEVLFSIAGKKD